MEIELILTALDERTSDAWQIFCGDYDFVSVHQGSILEVDCDAVVSPANSFGFMDGGIDALYTNHFGRDIEKKVRDEIFEQFNGELLVGQAFATETRNEKIPWLIVAPTMRVPMKLSEETVNPYLAMRAIFLLIQKCEILSGSFVGEKVSSHIKRIALPGLGTGVGKVSPFICARQVQKAIDDFLLGEFHIPNTWAEASEQHQLLYTDRLKRLQHD